MTIKELFGHFMLAFAKIVFFDMTNNVEDKIILNEAFDSFKYYQFLKDYGECNVIEWCYSSDNNCITVEFEH